MQTELQREPLLRAHGVDTQRLPSCGSGFPMWLVDTERSRADAACAMLTDEEVAAAQRFRFPALRHRYSIAHAALRILLRDVCQIPLLMQGVARNSFGKPRLINCPDTHFSVSYSGRWALIGINEGDPIGVDIEILRTIDDAGDLMDLHFTEAEISAVGNGASTDGDWSRRFLEIWVRKEACVKASGRGLSIPLKTVECISGEVQTAVRFGGGRYSTGALELGDPIMGWCRRKN